MYVGITGHQKLDGDRDWSWVESALTEELRQLPKPFTAVSSLAIGADQMFARIALRLGAALHVVMAFADLERTFSPDKLAEFVALRSHANKVEILTTIGTDEDCYLAAGQHVVDLSDMLVAIWNGLPARGKGGTGDVVLYARSKKVPLIHINPVIRQVTRS